METFLIVQRGDEIGRRIDLNADQLTIGRGSDNDVILNHPMVSRYHAVLKRQNGQYTLIDLGSSNPVVVNDQGLEAGVGRQLVHRDVLLIGRNVFSFQQRPGTTGRGQGSAPAQRPVDTPPSAQSAASDNDDRTIVTPLHGAIAPSAEHDQTMISGGGEAAPPPPPHFAPPPPPAAVHFDDDAPTNLSVPSVQDERMIGTPPSEDEGELPTQIIPRR